MTRDGLLAVACPTCKRGPGKPCRSTPGNPRVRVGMSAWSRTQRAHQSRHPENAGQSSVCVHTTRMAVAGAR